MDRMRVISGHLASPETSSLGSVTMQTTAGRRPRFSPPSPDDVVICSAKRTPMCKAKRGPLKDTLPDDLVSTVLTAVVNDTGLDPTLIQDICFGNVTQPGAGANTARIGQFFSGFPETVPLHTVNRQCSSGLQACANIGASIRAGFIDIGIGGGVESLSHSNFGQGAPPGFILNPRVADVDKARDCLIPMGITSENVAERYGITREQQDKMAMESHAKAAAAQKAGLFQAEITPITTCVRDKEGNEKQVTVTADDGIRAGTTMEILGKLKPAFQEGGSTTAGNSSQVTDGAAAVLMARRSAAQKHDLPILGVMKAFAVVGVPPDVMGIGPAYAIPKALEQAGLTVDDIDIYEINEAFASQATYCVDKLGIPMEKVNPKGGAIALGHPLGCTGARQIGTLLHELKRRGKRSYGVVSMCIGTGMGAAGVFEYPGPA